LLLYSAIPEESRCGVLKCVKISEYWPPLWSSSQSS
jgi:hypothetical protein